jgi:hypothetical protein
MSSGCCRVTAAEVGRDVRLGRHQASTNLRLLELAYLIILLPAWSTNLTARVVKGVILNLGEHTQRVGDRGPLGFFESPAPPTRSSARTPRWAGRRLVWFGQ